MPEPFIRQRRTNLANMANKSIIARMIKRHIEKQLVEALETAPAVALLGPRQVGKTTLALEIGETRPSIYLDLETSSDRAKLADPEAYLASHEDELVILDEVHRAPELFQSLRGLIDRGRRKGKKAGRFLLLGSASVDLLQQSGESLAGRISYLELGPLDALEAPPGDLENLWARGGFPASFLAANETISFRWRQDFIRDVYKRQLHEIAHAMTTTVDGQSDGHGAAFMGVYLRSPFLVKMSTLKPSLGISGQIEDFICK